MAELFLYMTTTGRKTGEPRSIEIWYVEHGGAFYLCAGNREKTQWVQNILANPAVTFSIGTRDNHNAYEPAQPGTGRILNPAREASLHHVVARLFDGKYGWSSGLLVEIRPDAPAEP